MLGSLDCCLWPADWIEKQTGVDPAADLRGTYRCATVAALRIRRAGGLSMLWAPRLAAAGLRRVGHAEPGDIGIVITPNGETGAIRTADGWACKRDRALIIAPFEPIACWGLRA